MVDYRIIRSARRKTVGITVHPDNRVEVRAPLMLSEHEIHRFIEQKRDWIDRKCHFNSRIRTPYRAKRFVQGESYSLLGNSYSLLIGRGKPAIAIHGDQLQLTTDDPDPKRCRALLVEWYRQQALDYLALRCAELGDPQELRPASVGIKSYCSRWGSCHHDGRIYFNWRLIMAPTWVVDHIVAHELCHLRHPNHSAAFHALVTTISPVQREAGAWLKQHGLSLDL